MATSPTGALVINPGGQSAVVTLTTPSGANVTAYQDSAGTTPFTFPVTISSTTTFYTVEQVTVTVSCKFDGIENANNNGATTTVDMENGGTASLSLTAPSPTLNLGDHVFLVTGVPPASLGINNDIALRLDGAAGAFIYQKRAGAWVASSA